MILAGACRSPFRAMVGRTAIANTNAVTPRGKWKLFQRANTKTVTDEETGVESEVTESYSLIAQFRLMGFCIILK